MDGAGVFAVSEWPLKYHGVEIHFDDPEEVKKWGVLVSQTEKATIEGMAKSLYGPNALLAEPGAIFSGNSTRN